MSQQSCFFNEITSIEKIQEESIYQQSQSNTQYYVNQSDKSINFLSKGGNQFFLPLDVEINQVFPLSEGLLLGWGRDEFNYSVVLNHPLASITTLGTYNSTLGTIEPWIHMQEEIIYAHKILPILITYNSQLMRHCVYILKVDDKQEVQNYNLTEKTDCQIISELYYEENIKEEKAKQCEIIKSNVDGELLICLLSDHTIRILEMNFLEENKSKNIFNSLKVVQTIQKVSQIQVFNMIDSIYAETISIKKEKLKYQNNQFEYVAYQIINHNNIPSNLLILHTNSAFTLLNGSKILLNYQINEQINDISQFNCAPVITEPLIQTILHSLKIALDTQQYICLFKDVIINCLQNQNLKLEMSKNNIDNEFMRFTYLMLCYLKLSSNKKDCEDQIQKKIKSNSSSMQQSPIKENSKSFQQLLKSNYHKENSSYNGNTQNSHQQQQSQQSLSFIYHMTMEMFNEIQDKILYVLHLLYQELLLSDEKQANKLLILLYYYSLNMDNEVAINYTDYYLRINPQLQSVYQNDSFISLLPTIRSLTLLGQPQQQNKQKILPQNPIDLNKWLSSLLMNNPISFPILFKKTKQLCIIMQSILKKQLIHISSILQSEVQDFQVLYQVQKTQLFFSKVLNQKLQMKYIQQKKNKLEMLTKLRGPSLMLYLCSEKRWNRDIINKLPLQFKIVILEIVTLLRNNFPNDLMGQITKDAYLLIDRMDIYLNCKLYIQNPVECEFKKYVNSILSGQIKSLQNEDDNDIQYDQHLMQQVKRQFDFTRDIRIKTKMTEHIPEERLDQDAPSVLLKLLNRKLAMFVGLGSLTYGTSDHFITDQIKFPQLNLSGILQQNSLKLTIDSTREDYTQMTQWPEFHLGVTLSLQLSKKLKGLSQESLRTWIFYQKPQNPSNIHGGFMLGLGLLGYLNSFNQIDLYQLLTQNHEATSVGVLLGIGASRIGTCDEPTQKSLTVHIPSLIPSVYDLELPSNVSTSALCSLGFLFMASGNRNFTEVALGLIGRKPHNDKVIDREGYSLAAGIALGLINLGKGSVWRRELQIVDRLIRFVQGGKVLPPPQSSLSTNFMQNESVSSSIREGSMVNVHVTCPAALMALSLMFMQMNQQNIVDQLNIPNSFSSLESCNPNHIILKSLTRNIIMWDSIPTTQEDLHSQIPELISFLFEQPLKKIHQKFYLVYNVEVIDFMSVSMIYTGMISGALLAMGIKYAGTHDQQIKQLMIKQIEFLVKLRISQNEFANDPDNKCAIDQYTYYTNIVNALQGLSLLMAGSFDQEVLTIAKSLIQKMENSQIWHFGFHQGIKMAIGFVFMGKGGYSFKKSKKAISMLLLSLYPYYPTNPGDNKQYLQALRWSYVLSIRPKIFKIIDVKTHKTVNLQIKNEIFSDPNYCRSNFSFTNKAVQTIYVQSKVLSQNNQDLLNPNNILNHIDTLLLIGDMQQIDSKLDGLYEYKFIKNLKEKQYFLKLLQHDQSNFIQILASLFNSNKYSHIPILVLFYKQYQNKLVLSQEVIDQLTPIISVTNQELNKYINQDLKNMHVSLVSKKIFSFLSIYNLPYLHDIKQIVKVAKQIPLQMLEFYLFKSFEDVQQEKLKQLAQSILLNL
ncbi:unnamed protein product [Paramecium pentaurelia]|uniref:Anaphase-promoting complex subunit 1 n=1 Tax=Paramecium pentaurelia TaxID=43138 RepID=A0A8S1YR83_9CILI|nr:unnamed protein product [Paramecium pentaurelia]